MKMLEAQIENQWYMDDSDEKSNIGMFLTVVKV